MTNPNLRINEFINRAQLEIIDKLEERFTSVLNNSIQQLKTFSKLSIDKFDEFLLNKFSIPTNRFIARLINQLSLCFWRLIELIVEFSFYVQQQQSPYDLDQLNILEASLLSHIELLNEYHRQRCDLLSRSSSVLIHEFDEKISADLCRIANEISNKLCLISLPNNTISIAGNT